MAGDTLLGHAQGIFGDQSQGTGVHSGARPSAPPQGGALSALTGAAATVQVATTPGVWFERDGAGVKACEINGTREHCVPVTLETPRHVVLSDGDAGYICRATNNGLACTPL